ncbi:MAG: SOS response-associated peptidase family protein [Sphingomonadales bacterium]|nr:SOS response-associated peptidase family protein [Sphingomonadales bacterium]MBD3774662.1 SOS response-associated peptidase family protein [Paracoccaceae bacterium]
MLFRLDASAAEIAAHFAARSGDDPWAGGHVAPGSFAPVITAGREFVAGPRPAGRRLQTRMIPRLWGVPPPPSVADPARSVLSVRNPDSPFWIGNLRNSEFRCLVPATAFMEWGKGRDREGRRVRRWFAPSDQPIFAFAGVWKDSEVPSFALLTCEPNAPLRAAGCEAMPAILPPDPQAQQLWLHGGWDRAQALLAPYPGSLMRERAEP